MKTVEKRAFFENSQLYYLFKNDNEVEKMKYPTKIRFAITRIEIKSEILPQSINF